MGPSGTYVMWGPKYDGESAAEYSRLSLDAWIVWRFGTVSGAFKNRITLAGVRGEMARLYRLGLNGKLRSDEMTRFIYALKEIRACLEAEALTDIQQRLALLSRDMDTHNGQRISHQPAISRS